MGGKGRTPGRRSPCRATGRGLHHYVAAVEVSSKPRPFQIKGSGTQSQLQHLRQGLGPSAHKARLPNPRLGTRLTNVALSLREGVRLSPRQRFRLRWRGPKQFSRRRGCICAARSFQLAVVTVTRAIRCNDYRCKASKHAERAALRTLRIGKRRIKSCPH